MESQCKSPKLEDCSMQSNERWKFKTTKNSSEPNNSKNLAPSLGKIRYLQNIMIYFMNEMIILVCSIQNSI